MAAGRAARAGRRRGRGATLLMALGLAACREGPPAPPPPPRDTTAPRLEIVQPGGAFGFDRDSNGLVDLEVRWTDSGGAVALSTLRVRSRPGPPGVPEDTNLARGWTLHRLDSTGAILEESVPLLLRPGDYFLVVSVADTAGNAATVTSPAFSVPVASFHRSIGLDYRPEWQQVRGVNLALNPEGTKGYVPFIDGHVAVFDPEGREPTRYIGPIANSGFAAQISVDTATGLAYIGGGGQETAGYSVLDTRTEQYLGWHWAGGLGLASVYVHDSRLFVGESCTNGRIFVYDKATHTELARVQVGAVGVPGSCPNSRAFEVTSDGRVGWAATVEAGLVWFNAERYSLLGILDIEPPSTNGRMGNARDIKLLGDRWLYLARLGWGLDEYDVRMMTLASHAGDARDYKELALSPDGRLLFATCSADDGRPPPIQAHKLYRVPGLQLLHAFPQRPGLIADAAVFHPDGKRVFVMASFQVDVYLIRPQP